MRGCFLVVKLFATLLHLEELSTFVLLNFSMVKRIVHILVSGTLVFLLMLNGISHEFVHSFTGHEDTVDVVHCNHHHGVHASFEKVHHHCDFLELQTPVFLTSSLYYQYYTPFEHNDFFVLQKVAALNPVTIHTALRGPPFKG